MTYDLKQRGGKLILLTAIIASGMAFLDGTVVNIALPVIQESFGASLGQLAWIVNAFALTLASFLLISGALADRLGRKKMFLFGIVLFTLSSLWCALARDATMLIIARAVQGLGAAIMIPGSLTIINLSFESSTRGKAIGLWSGLSGGIAALGPFLGGALVQSFGWPSIFLINLPLGVIAFLVGWWVIAESKAEQEGKIDWWGVILLVLGLTGLSYGLMQAPARGFSHPFILAGLIGGAVLLVAFILLELRIANAIMPLHIFKNRLVAGANLVTLFLYFALYGTIFFLPLIFQQAQGYTPLQAGLALLPSILIITFLSGPAGGLADKIGPRKQMIFGPLTVAIGFASLIWPNVGTNYWTGYFPGLALFGLGMAFVIAPLTKSALSVEERFSGAASGVNNAVSRIAALLAVAILGIVALGLFGDNLAEKLKQTSLHEAQRQEIKNQADKLGGIEIPETFNQVEASEAARVIDEAFVFSFRWIAGINALLAFLSALVSVWLIRPKVKPVI
ncbi:MAG: MFS transporter [Candidatus Doudnabacteria bacterium]|nr:MFS transporter [Candidatus Doudnabacteria bacterium]